MTEENYNSEEETAELMRVSKLPKPLRLAAMMERTMQWPLHGKAADCLREMYDLLQALDKKAENARELGLDYEPPLSEKEFLEAEIKRLEHNEEVLMNALFKACGDDAQVVQETIDSQGELK